MLASKLLHICMGYIHPIKALHTYVWVPYICLQPSISSYYIFFPAAHTILAMLQGVILHHYSPQ